MPKTYVERTISIAASAEKVKSIITDFNHWTPWSPWIILEPETKVTVSADNKTQEWEGKRIGSGRMEIAGETGSRIHYDLTFLKPWKSKAKADFVVEPVDENNTNLTWTMEGSLPFFMFFMKKLMERMIGMDYDRGLLMLKDYIESGKVNASLKFIGNENYDGCKYVGVKNECKIDDIGEVMEADFKKLNDFANSNKETITDEIFTLYHKFDFNRNKVVYTSAVGVKTLPENVPAGMISGNVEATKLHTVQHTGPYELSGNAWSAIMAMERAKEFKKNKKIPPIEFYRNNPLETDPKDLVTDVSMPVL